MLVYIRIPQGSIMVSRSVDIRKKRSLLNLVLKVHDYDYGRLQGLILKLY
jgi:hypothetical protein